MGKLTVEDTSLVSVADAIRTKGGTTDQLVFPDGFVSAIEGIQSGGGGGENYLPGFVDGSLTEITADMLAGCKTIRNYAFNYAQITSIVLPSTLKSIGNSAFNACSKLTSMVIPEGVTSIGNSAFHGAGLISLDLPNTLNSIGSYSFQDCSNLTSITIPDSVTSIASGAFYGCSKLTSIDFPSALTSIGTNLLYNCTSLTTIRMKRTTPPTLSTSSFRNCTALTTIIVPAGTLSAYRSATNWSAYADKMVEASS